MADTDGEIKIKTKIETDSTDKDLTNLKGKLGKLTGSGVLKGVMGLGAAFTSVSVAVKAVTKTIKETTQAYQTQRKAEIQLETAAKNNPYLDSKSVKSLKSYASELQKIGTIGDEQILPLMSNLAAAGRTQEEIQNIMSAALDVSASGMMSLESAVQSLNASYSGNVGLLGRQISELKTLTKEELASGKAVEIIGEKFKGMSKSVTEATGTSQQLKNAWGDLKEEIGAGFEKALSPMRKFFTELLSKAADSKKALRELNEARDNIENGAASSGDYELAIDAAKQEIERLKGEIDSTLALLNDQDALNKKIAESRGYYSKSTAQNYLAQMQRAYEKQVALLDQLNKDLTEQSKLEQEKAKAAADTARELERQAKAQERNKSASDIINSNDAALRKQLEQQEINARLKGEEIDKQERLNILISSYVDLVTTSSLVTENNPFSKKRLAELEAYAKEIKGVNFNYEELEASIKEFLGGDEQEPPLSTAINSAIESLNEERAALEENSTAWEQYTNKIKELEELKTKVIKKEEDLAVKKVKDSAVEITGTIKDYISQFADIVNSVSDLMTQNATAENDKALADISEQYTDGLISYEEYCDKKNEISKKQARDEYKIQMWTWTASLLQATANIAEGVAKAIAQGGVAGVVTGALVAAAGAAQIATITASKPTAPGFMDGGVIGGIRGASYGSDNTVINARQGEMVLNAIQQAQLWKVANGGGNSGGVSLNVDITNNAANDVRASARITSHGLQVTIDKLVNTSMAEGKYNDSMQNANNIKNGVTYL